MAYRPFYFQHLTRHTFANFWHTLIWKWVKNLLQLLPSALVLRNYGKRCNVSQDEPHREYGKGISDGIRSEICLHEKLVNRNWTPSRYCGYITPLRQNVYPRFKKLNKVRTGTVETFVPKPPLRHVPSLHQTTRLWIMPGCQLPSCQTQFLWRRLCDFRFFPRDWCWLNWTGHTRFLGLLRYLSLCPSLGFVLACTYIRVIIIYDPEIKDSLYYFLYLTSLRKLKAFNSMYGV